jgi:hypothetical protein
MERHYELALELKETMDETAAVARLRLYGETFEATGVARRNPADPAIPAIGEEIAVARALSALSAAMMEAAGDKLAKYSQN